MVSTFSFRPTFILPIDDAAEKLAICIRSRLNETAAMTFVVKSAN